MRQGQSPPLRPASTGLIDRGGMHQIGEVAQRLGLSLRTVRYYEEAGLVVPSGRTPGKFRLYTDEDIERLALIKRMKPLGFSIDEMRDLLALRDQLTSTGLDDAQRASLERQLQEFAAAAARRCDELRRQLEHAQAFADTLAAEVEKHAPREPGLP